jgi:hypothetical protein
MAIKTIIFFILAVAPTCQSFSQVVNYQEILKGFEIIAEPKCKKLKIKEPPAPIAAIWYERSYISVDGSESCQIHQLAIYWMSDSLADNRRYVESKLYRYEKGKWSEEFGLDYVPKFRIRNKSNNRTYLLVDKDFGDFQVRQIAYYSGSWEKVWCFPGKFGIQTVWADCLSSVDCDHERQTVERAVQLIAPKN